MAARQFIGQFASGATPITVTGNSPILSNVSGFNSVDVEIYITAAPTGTTPALTVQLMGSLDGVNFYNIGSATASLNATGRTLLTNNNVDEPYLKLAYVVTGTTPSFGGVEINAYGF